MVQLSTASHLQLDFPSPAGKTPSGGSSHRCCGRRLFLFSPGDFSSSLTPQLPGFMAKLDSLVPPLNMLTIAGTSSVNPLAAVSVLATGVPTQLQNLCLVLNEEGTNYLQWAHNFRHFLSVQRCWQYITNLPPPKNDPHCPAWTARDETI